MNWGKGIILVFVGFTAVMATMVTICVQQDDIHLVTPNYYEEEIRYQEHIQKVENAAGLGQEALSFDGSRKTLEVGLKKGAAGTLWLFRPSDARLDQKLALRFSDDEARQVDLKDLLPGFWRVKLTWDEGEKSYYQEMKINL